MHKSFFFARIYDSVFFLQNQALLAAAESKLVEDKKQYDLMLESKQLELSRHLKDISQRNDQVLFLVIFLYGYHTGSLSTFGLTVRGFN